MNIINYFKELRKERKRKRAKQGIRYMSKLIDVMVADGTMTKERGSDILMAAIDAYLDM